VEGVKSLYREPERAEERSFGALELHDVFKIYRSERTETVALRGLDLRVEQGELVALFGPSGSGKSTALALAAALDRASAGEVRAFGESLSLLDEPALARYRATTVALVLQSENLFPALSARGNVALTLRLAGTPATRAEIDDTLAHFGLERGGQRAGTLSGGEQQRVALAAAAARKARLVLADEPTAELDVANERTVLESLATLRRDFGATVVVVTHSERVAEAADRVVEIRDGVAA
jgi:putative ABC transport system ATP-binding protein